ncbi:hypothetical protein SCLCIDRAFT_26052 [Scleroderma citrinum Foug A]|uniref:Uncharacterized protein n=1 Tax=Scleroderma citrinum Foug A TaxID=1036808 RepID=A0A0C3A8S3_9AGAM|nr:hypothetical protein SCLCIDRAFT_26047 [Scleroderma citrinum Foug A]KIM61272.1 hypothetical protein SCLCIDRAFT_26052 [Scleroderma citrinum Foug A]
MSDTPLPPQVVIRSVVSDQLVGTTTITDDAIATGVPPGTKLIIVNPMISVPPPQFQLRRVDRTQPVYEIFAGNDYVRDGEPEHVRGLVFAFADPPAQKFVFTYVEKHGAYTIVKLGTNDALTDPFSKDIRGAERSIRLRPLKPEDELGNSGQLFTVRDDEPQRD